MLGNPAAGGQLLEESFVETARAAVIDVLDRRLAVAQLRIAQPAFEPLRAAMGRLAIDHQRQPLAGARSLARSCDCSSTKASAMPSSRKARSWSRVGCVSIVVVSSVEVAGATDVGMNYRRPVRGGVRPSAIEVGLQDRGDRSVRAGADLEGAGAGRLQPLMSEAGRVPEDTDRGAKALLGVRTLAPADLEECRRLWPDLVRSPLDTFRCPVSIASMARWHMLAHGRVFAAGRRTHVDRDAIAAMEQLDGTRGDPRPQRLAQQPMRHRVVVLLDLDVI